MASFRVEVDREIHKATRRLPGNIRQRVLRALKGLRDEPRPAGSEALDIGEFELPPGVEPRRIRMESWAAQPPARSSESRFQAFRIGLLDPGFSAGTFPRQHLSPARSDVQIDGQAPLGLREWRHA